MNALIALTSREIKKWYRRKVAIVFTFITPLFWLALFGKSLNLYTLFRIPNNLPPEIVQVVQNIIDSIILGAFGTKDYFTFIATGMFTVFILFSSMFSGMSLIFDRRLGFLNRLLVAPIKRETIFFSRVLASVTRSVLQFTGLFIMAVALGINFGEGFGPIHLLLLYLNLALVSMIFSNIFISMMIRVSEHDTAISLANLLNLPLMFASNSLFPKDQMPEWLRVVAEINPITHSNKIVRTLIIEASLDLPVESLLYLVLLGIGSALLGFMLSRRYLKHV